MHQFYNGLSVHTRTLIDASTGGTIMEKNEIEAYQILENIVLNNCQWPTKRAVPKKVAGVCGPYPIHGPAQFAFK